MNHTRTIAFALAAAAGFATAAAQARPNFVPLTQQTVNSLKYGGSLNHPSHGSGHTFLAPTVAECNNMIWQSRQEHLAHTHANCDLQEMDIQACQKRSFFEISAPTGGGTNGVTTIMVHLPSNLVNALGDLRERYRIDAYEADIAKLGGE